METICPMDIKAMVQLAANNTVWNKWVSKPENLHLAPRPLLAPIRALAAARRSDGVNTWTRAIAGQLPQAELARRKDGIELGK